MVAIDDSPRGDEERGCVTCRVACAAERSLSRDKLLSDDVDGTPGLKSEPIPAPCPYSFRPGLDPLRGRGEADGRW